jgi:DNA polymerase III alpha subunit
MKNFPTPHCHPESLDTASTPADFYEREVELGSTAITCTDHGYMGACREVYALATEGGKNKKGEKIIPILGLEGYVRDDDCSILKASGIDKDEKGTFAKYNKYYHMTFHALDQKGYEAMAHELSMADFRAEQHGSERKPLFTWGQVERLGQYNITMTSGCLIGMVQRHLLSDRPDIAVKYYDRLRSIPKPGNFYVEIFPHRCTHYWVSGVFLTLEGGQKLKYWKQKKVKTTNYDDITVEDLAKVVARGREAGKLVAVMDNRKWVEREPVQILNAEVVEDFLQNECRPWCADGDVQLGANKFMMHLAQTRGDKMLISDDAHFATADEKIVQDCRLGGAGGSWKFHNSYHRQTSGEAWGYFQSAMGMNLKTFEGMVDTNREWAQRFKDFKFEDRQSLPKSFYPSDTKSHLMTLIDKHGRMSWDKPEYVTRLNKEIELLNNNGKIDLLPYFFLAEEVNYFYETKKLLTGPGRGSAAGMLTTYVLGITHVDPLRYNLSEDRFLTLDRIKAGKLPDIDMDFPKQDRDLLVNPENGWLYRRFGKCAAAISTNMKLRLKNSIKDVHRALHGRVDVEIEMLTKKLPQPPQGIEDWDFVFGYVADDGKEVKGLMDESKDLQEYTKKFPKEWEIVKKMLGVVRGKSRHASAYVVADEAIDNFIPVQTIGGVRATQYTAAWVEAAGGIKMDFLGLNTLSDLSSAVEMIQKTHGGIISEDRILNGVRVPGFRLVPFNGKMYDVWDLPEMTPVFNDIAEGKTETVFQLNTNSARQWLNEFNYVKKPKSIRDLDKPLALAMTHDRMVQEWEVDRIAIQNLKVKAIDSIEAISAFTALDRPGPLDAKVKDVKTGREHNMLVEYANRAKGLAPTGNIPALDDRLKDTYGVMVYQEQLEAMFRELTGMTAAQAEAFRRAVAKKDMEKVLKSYGPFMAGATPKMGEVQAKAVWDQMVTFGQYGFNKSHSVCYSHIAYACAFLKHYYPVEWWCAVLRNADKKEITEKFWRYCKQWVDGPDVRHSGDHFEIQNGRIRTPLSFINGVGEGAHNELVAGRPFHNIDDFCEKIVTHKVKNAKPVMGTDGKQEVDKKGKPKFRVGTSALNRGVVSKLIVSGVMDSLFNDPERSIASKLEDYEDAMHTATVTLMGKGKPGKVDSKYINLTPITRFQMQKTILPIYSEDVLPILERAGVDGITKTDGEYRYRPEEAETIRTIKTQKEKGVDKMLESLPILSGSQLKFYNEEYEIYDGQYVGCAVAAYVISERRFNYKGNKTAVELVLDVDGEQFSFVKWANYETGRQTMPSGLEGSVAIVLLTRWKKDRPFGIDAAVVVSPPLSDATEESAESSS